MDTRILSNCVSCLSPYSWAIVRILKTSPNIILSNDHRAVTSYVTPCFNFTSGFKDTCCWELFTKNTSRIECHVVTISLPKACASIL